MIPFILVILISAVLIFLIRAASKTQNTSESKLSVFDHPSTFEKPDIEMVSESVNEHKAEKETGATASFQQLQNEGHDED